MTPQQRSRDRGGKRRELVLEAALTIFAEHGYQASMGEMARAAGITRTVLYYYFDSKQALFEAVYEAQMAALFEFLSKAALAPGTLDDRVRQTLTHLLTFAERNPQSWEILFRQADETDPEVVDIRSRALNGFTTSARLLLAEDIKQRGLMADGREVEIGIEMVRGGLIQAVAWWQANPTVSLEAVADVASKVCLGIVSSFEIKEQAAI